jgi:hypothetical protein
VVLYKLETVPTYIAGEMSSPVPDSPQYECYQPLLLQSEIELTIWLPHWDSIPY